MNKLIITVVGKDTVGIIARVCTYLADKQVNILDISQTIVQDYFNMMMIVDMTNAVSNTKMRSPGSGPYMAILLSRWSVLGQKRCAGAGVLALCEWHDGEAAATWGRPGKCSYRWG